MNCVSPWRGLPLRQAGLAVSMSRSPYAVVPQLNSGTPSSIDATILLQGLWQFSRLIDSIGIPQKSLTSVETDDTVYDEPVVNEETIVTEVVEERSYGPSSRQKYRLSIPEGVNPDDAKMVVLVHGGSFRGGSLDDESIQKIEQQFLDNGYIVANMEYRVMKDGEPVQWPEPMHDIRDGINHAYYYLTQEKGIQISDKTYVGNSAGATAGAHLLYSDAFDKGDDKVPLFDHFVSLSGVFSASAYSPSDPSQSDDFRKMFSKSDLDAEALKATEAFLFEGTQDGLDRFAGTSRSHAETLSQFVQKHQGQATVSWIEQEAYSGHSGSKKLMANSETAFRTLLTYLAQ